MLGDVRLAGEFGGPVKIASPGAPCHTHRMTRINARIDAALARKIRLIRERTKQSTTEVVKASIESYYEAVTREGPPAKLLADLVGSAKGRADLSAKYKQHLAASLGEKADR